MSGSYFLDSNVLIYSFDARAPAKKAVAQALVEKALAEGVGIVSFQVVQEFFNVATQRFPEPMSAVEATLYLDRVLMPLCRVFPSAELYRSTLALAERWRYSFFDSLILAAAQAGGCQTLYTEDLQHGQDIEGLRIVNPFNAGAEVPTGEPGSSLSGQ
jgi:predicted nucleic acid-binding protein